MGGRPKSKRTLSATQRRDLQALTGLSKVTVRYIYYPVPGRTVRKASWLRAAEGATALSLPMPPPFSTTPAERLKKRENQKPPHHGESALIEAIFQTATEIAIGLVRERMAHEITRATKGHRP